MQTAAARLADSAAEQVLVVGPAWVGDMVMAHSLFQVLRRRFPGCHLTVLAPAWTGALLERMPEVGAALPAPFRHGALQLAERRRLGHRLRRQGLTRAIILPGSLKAALVPYFARIPVRTAFRGEFRYGLVNDMRSLDRERLPRTVDRFVALGLAPGAALPDPVPQPRLTADPGGGRAAAARLGLETDRRPVLALCPGAEYGPAKRWPQSHFAAVARTFLDRGWEVWLFGSGHDRAVTAAIAAAAPGCADLAGRTTLGEAVDLMALSRAVVSNDSGLMHVAAALERRLIALFGSSSPRFTPPLSERATVLTLALDCSPCFARECPLGHTRCLTGLDPERVIAALDGA